MSGKLGTLITIADDFDNGVDIYVSNLAAIRTYTHYVSAQEPVYVVTLIPAGVEDVRARISMKFNSRYKCATAAGRIRELMLDWSSADAQGDLSPLPDCVQLAPHSAESDLESEMGDKNIKWRWWRK